MCRRIPFNLDFPHLMLRYRAAEAKAGKKDFTQRQLAQMDRNGRLAAIASPIANWASAKGNALTRPLMEKTVGIDRDAQLPKFHTRTFMAADRGDPISPNRNAPAFGKRKAAIFATCFVNYNKPSTGMAARAVLNHIGVETRAAYPGCCGMPFLEQARARPRGRTGRESVEGSGEADRRRLRHRHADGIVRADAEIRMGADRARK